MRFGILADIHGNLEALEAVLRDARSNQCSQFVCLGDIVGYNADPKACFDIVSSMGILCVKGNHEEYLSVGSVEGFTPRAAKIVEWTRMQFSPTEIRWMTDLPLVLTTPDFTLVHASLESPHLWSYVFDSAAAASSFLHQGTDICFFGHTHVPMYFEMTRKIRSGTFSTLKISQGRKYLVNVGSVGQPRDGNLAAAYGIYDDVPELLSYGASSTISWEHGERSRSGIPRYNRAE